MQLHVAAAYTAWLSINGTDKRTGGRTDNGPSHRRLPPEAASASKTDLVAHVDVRLVADALYDSRARLAEHQVRQAGAVWRHHRHGRREHVRRNRQTRRRTVAENLQRNAPAQYMMERWRKKLNVKNWE